MARAPDVRTARRSMADVTPAGVPTGPARRLRRDRRGRAPPPAGWPAVPAMATGASSSTTSCWTRRPAWAAPGPAGRRGRVRRRGRAAPPRGRAARSRSRRLFPAQARRPARIVVYRRPVEAGPRRARARRSCRTSWSSRSRPCWASRRPTRPPLRRRHGLSPATATADRDATAGPEPACYCGISSSPALVVRSSASVSGSTLISSPLASSPS